MKATNLLTKVGFGLMSVAALASSVLAVDYTYSYGTDTTTAADSAAAGGLAAFGIGIWILVCCASILGIAAVVFNIWMIIDVMKRTEAELPNRQTWMIILIVTLLLGFGFIPSLVYFFGARKQLQAAVKK